MTLPKELAELSKSTDIPFQPRWEFGRFSGASVCFLGRCYESRYKGHVIRYYKKTLIDDNLDDSDALENRLKLFHSRPLHLGLQCYFKVSQFNLGLNWSESRNLFASKLRTPYSDIKCYAATKSVAEALLSQNKTIKACTELRDFVQKLMSGRFVLVDDGLMIFSHKKPDTHMLDALHQLSRALVEFPLLPHKRAHWTLPLPFLGGLLAFLAALVALMIMLPRAS